MKWIAISGGWRKINDIVSNDVKETVRHFLNKGFGIVTGGALGVDYIATETALKGGNIKQIKIYLPILLDSFCKHYWNRANEGVISKDQAELITSQLNEVHNISPSSVIDKTPYTEANVESYYARNTSIVNACDILYAFWINKSKGTKDAIDKAREMGKNVIVKEYSIS